MGSLKELGGKYSKVYYDDKKYIKLVEGLKFLSKNRVYVGIPEDPKSNDRKETDGEYVTNAQLLFLHTNGSETMNIPKRPVLEPAIKANQDNIEKWLKKAVESNLTDGKRGMINNLEKAGIAAMNASKRWFTDPRNGWAPNSPFTLYGGWARNRVSGKLFYAKGKYPKTNPLINTGQLRNSITYVIGRVK